MFDAQLFSNQTTIAAALVVAHARTLKTTTIKG
jgi:hypothetical protein